MVKFLTSFILYSLTSWTFIYSQTQPVRPKGPISISPPLEYPSNFIAEVVISSNTDAEILGWKKIQLKMDYSNVAHLVESEYVWLESKEELFPDIVENFYPGVVSNPSPAVISIYPNQYFDRFHMQFNQRSQLYLIEIQFSKAQYDYLSLLNLLTQKYGEPQSLNAKRATWKKDERLLIMERSNTLKYLDKSVLPAEQRKISRLIEELEKKQRDDMVNEL